MPSRRILVIEDDSAIRRGIVDALRFKGFVVLEAANGKDGSQMAEGCDCDLVLLDLVLPGKGGLEILGDLRQSRPTLPVIILTAKGEENDRVAGLSTGADEYVVKPFSVRELLARVEAVLRRSPARPPVVRRAPVPGGRADLGRRGGRGGGGRRGGAGGGFGGGGGGFSPGGGPGAALLPREPRRSGDLPRGDPR